jgi:hypothetical protein
MGFGPIGKYREGHRDLGGQVGGLPHFATNSGRENLLISEAKPRQMVLEKGMEVDDRSQTPMSMDCDRPIRLIVSRYASCFMALFTQATVYSSP